MGEGIVEEIKILREQGKNYTDIGYGLGISVSAVRHIHELVEMKK